MTGRELIRRSLLLINAIASGETPNSNEENDSLNSLNNMIEAWSIDGLLINAVTREVFTPTPSLQTQTMGPTGTFVTTRPVKIQRVGVINNSIEIPVALYTYDLWAAIPNKSNTSNIPQVVYIEGTYPNETLNFWPIPSGSNQVTIYSLKQLTQVTSLSAALSFPPGYQRALEYNLAIELSPSFGKVPTEILMSAAIESKADIKRQNVSSEPLLTSDVVTSTQSGAFNWITGE